MSQEVMSSDSEQKKSTCDKFEKKIEALEKKLQQTATKTSSKEKCWPIHAIIGAIIPFIIAGLLWFIKPSIVMVPRPGTTNTELSYSKLLLWDVGITVVLWGMVAGHYYYMGNNSKICAK